MAELLTPQDMERLAADAGKSMAEVCRSAGVAPSTFWRWKSGKTAPNLTVYQRLLAEVRGAPAADPVA